MRERELTCQKFACQRERTFLEVYFQAFENFEKGNGFLSYMNYVLVEVQ